MRAAIGMHIDEMKQLALAKEKEVYKARLKMLNATNEEQMMMLQNRTGKNKLDVVAKTGDFTKKVGIIRDKRKKREMREARNERLRELGLEPPTDDDDSMFDFLNGSLLSNVMEVAGGDDELVEVDPIHDEELMELFNYGNDSDNESYAEIEEDLMKMFAAPEENLEMDSTSGGLKFANSDEEEEADFLAELDKDLLFLDDGEAAVERARALEKHEKEKQAEEERAEQELKAQIESMKDGIQRMAIEDNTKRSRKERYKARRNRKNLACGGRKGQT